MHDLPPRHAVRARRVGLALLVLLVFLAGRVPALSRSLWLDEVYAVRMADRPLTEIPAATATKDTHPPGFYLLLGHWLRGGTSEAWLRLLPLLLALLQLVVLFHLVRLLTEDRRAPWYAVFLAASLHTLAWPAYELRSFALANLEVTAAWWCVAAGLARRAWWPWVLAGAAFAAMAWTFYATALAWLGLVAFVLVASGRPRPWGRLLAACALALVLFLPWVPSALGQVEMARGAAARMWPTPAEADGVLKHALSRTAPWRRLSWPGIVLALAFFAWLGRTRQAFRGRDGRALAGCLAFALVASAGMALVWATTGVFSSRYVTFLAVPWTVALALALARLRPRVAVAVVLLLVGLNLADAVHRSLRPPQEDWRGLAARLDAGLVDGDAVAFTRIWYVFPYEHYAHERPSAMPVLDAAGGDVGDHPRVWAVWVGVEGAERRAIEARLEGAGYVSAAREGFGRFLELELFRRR